ncbi:MAG: nucleoside deaminase [candidate division WOR-3 bacterium]|jgi:tRNA(Arg) A34 adenosine deaminase TadA|nr:nucleoside deaminase [candidate division WOR-3 bacterium]MCR4423128.1 nucleoside deaminase [candidate division WOR-3 bacterium]MDH7518467.1 nucleoside deaminase [bacterium]
MGETVSDHQAMERAIEQALAGIAAGQAPFGCVIVKNGVIIAAAHNTVWQDNDPSAHAEVNAVRQACRHLGTIHLIDAVMYCTCEPCPMCYSLAHWARIGKIVFGARIGDARAAGFNELAISALQMKTIGQDKIEIVPDFLADRCRQIFNLWRNQGQSKPY